MATTINTVYLSGCNYQVKYDLVSQSVANNTSTIKVYGVLNVTNNYVSWSSGTAQVYNTSVGIGTYYSRGSYTLVQETVTITHNDDGTKSVYVGGSLNTTFVSGSTGGTIKLPTIARASQPSCITWPNTTQDVGNIGDTITIHMNRKSTSFTHTVRYSWYNKTGTIATNVKDSCQWTIPINFADDIPTETKSWGTIYADTYNGSTLIGTKSVRFDCHVANANPIFSNFEFAEQETTSLTGSTTRFIKGYSDVRITISNANKATAQKGATMKSYQTTIGTKTQKSSNLTYPVNYNLYDVDSATIDTWAIDSRGNSTKVRKTATLVNYNPVSYSTFTLERQSNTGTTTTLKFNGKIDLVNFGAVTNQLKSIKYYYKRYGAADSTYVQGATTLNPTVDSNGNITINQSIQGDISGGGFNQSNQYTIKIEIVDELLNVYNRKFTATATLGSGSPAIAVKGNSIAIGRNYDESAGGRVQIPTDTKVYINGAWRGIFSGNYINKDLIEQPTVLYNNSSGTTGTVTLSQTINNFSYIEIFFSKNINREKNGLSSIRITRTSGTEYASMMVYSDDTNKPQILAKNVKLNGTSITNVTSYYINFTASGVSTGSSNEISIYRVLGYK